MVNFENLFHIEIIVPNIEHGMRELSSHLIVDTIHNLSSTIPSRMSHPLERKLRDAHQAASHALISWRQYRNWGETFLGEDPPTFGQNPLNK